MYTHMHESRYARIMLLLVPSFVMLMGGGLQGNFIYIYSKWTKGFNNMIKKKLFSVHNIDIYYF